jgi:hypothetical protein
MDRVINEEPEGSMADCMNKMNADFAFAVKAILSEG